MPVKSPPSYLFSICTGNLFWSTLILKYLLNFQKKCFPPYIIHTTDSYNACGMYEECWSLNTGFKIMICGSWFMNWIMTFAIRILDNWSKITNQKVLMWQAYCSSCDSLVYFVGSDILSDQHVIFYWTYSYWDFAIFLCAVNVYTVKLVWYTV